jgi:hypothetical protein
VVTVVALVLVLVVAGGVFVIFKGGGLKTGSAVANVTWKAPVGGVASSTASFTGKVDGLALEGRATGVSPIAGGQAVLHAGHWTGTLGGTAFSLEVAESIGSGPSTGVVNKFLGTFAITFHITGTYGTDKVSATAVPDLHNGGRLSFSGTVGTYHVKGNMSVPHQKGTKERVRATFVLKG